MHLLSPHFLWRVLVEVCRVRKGKATSIYWVLRCVRYGLNTKGDEQVELWETWSLIIKTTSWPGWKQDSTQGRICFQCPYSQFDAWRVVCPWVCGPPVPPNNLSCLKTVAEAIGGNCKLNTSVLLQRGKGCPLRWQLCHCRYWKLVATSQAYHRGSCVTEELTPVTLQHRALVILGPQNMYALNSGLKNDLVNRSLESNLCPRLKGENLKPFIHRITARVNDWQRRLCIGV